MGIEEEKSPKCVCVRVDFQESSLVAGYRLLLISGTLPLENLPWHQERDRLDILKKKN